VQNNKKSYNSFKKKLILVYFIFFKYKPMKKLLFLIPVISIMWLLTGCGENVTTPTATSEGVAPPLYLSQMDACEKEGGQVKKETKDMGTWKALSQWECVCKSGSSVFDGNLACNQWLQPAN
jgi:hypothetical protein